MEFCPNCGTRLVLRRKGTREDGRVTFVCNKCGLAREVDTEVPLAVRTTARDVQERIAVISEQEAKIQTMPIAKVECPRCGNKEANWWMVQTRGADESPTQFFRCTECGYTWREST